MNRTKTGRSLVTFVVAIALLATAVCVTGCGGSGGGSSTEASEPKEVQYRVKNGIDADVELVGFDESGITLKFTASHGNIVVFPKTIEVAGQRFSMLGSDDNQNPAIHMTVGDAENRSSIEMNDGDTTTVKVSIDGVTDYHDFKMTVDNTMYTDSDTWPIKDVSFEVVES